MNVIYLHNVVNLDAARHQHQLELSQREIGRIANALIGDHVVSPHLNLALHLGYKPTMTNEEAAVRFVEEQLQLIDEPLATAMLNVMFDRFQLRLSRIPSHLQGGF